MKFIPLFSGTYSILLRGNDWRRFWSICTYRGIQFLEVFYADQYDDFKTTKECYCRIYENDYFELTKIAEKTNIEVILLNKYGFHKWKNKLKERYSFFIGAITALFLIIILSGRIWNIEISGNQHYSTEKIVRYFNTKNITAGIASANIDCFQIASDLREEFPYITWASAEKNGSTLIIYIKENEFTNMLEKSYEHENGCYNLVAEKDGIISDILVRNGLAQVEIGQCVKKGDVLISGYFPILNDAGEILSYEETKADGAVRIQCEYSYFDELNRIYENHIPEKRKTITYLEILNYRIVPWIIKSNKNSDIINENYELNITDFCALPFRIGQQQMIPYTIIRQYYSDEELKTICNIKFHEFCAILEKKGVQICENNVKMVLSEMSCTMSGNLTVIEQTGELKKAIVPGHEEDYMEESNIE